jgi:hypothetical protein
MVVIGFFGTVETVETVVEELMILSVASQSFYTSRVCPTGWDIPNKSTMWKIRKSLKRLTNVGRFLRSRLSSFNLSV